MKLACIGNALLDVISFVPCDLPRRLGLAAGHTEHVGHDELRSALRALGNPPGAAGGGAANVAKAFAALGGAASFAGSVGADEAGKRYAADLAAAGVRAWLADSGRPTGVFCAMISPDGSRSVVVNPGASSDLAVDRIPDSFFDPAAVLYLDGYLATEPGRLEAAVERAEAAGMRVALDVGGRHLAAANAGLFRGLVERRCDWSFMNEDEFVALYGLGVFDGLPRAARRSRGAVVVKRAGEGAVSWAEGSVVESPVRSIRVLDDTGAGDAFAAGYLNAALAGNPVERCLRLGNRVAEHAIQVPGMALDRERLLRAAESLR